MPINKIFKHGTTKYLIRVGVLSTACEINCHTGRWLTHTGEVEIPEVWLQAQASVQAQLDQEVVAEAADLAEAQWSEMTLVARFSQARGSFVDLDLVGGAAGERCQGILTEVSASGEFILMHRVDNGSSRTYEQLIRTSCIYSGRGLPRGLAPVVEALARTRIGFREGSWLRGKWGSRVIIKIYGSSNLVHGRVAAVGRDFIEIETGNGMDNRLVVALGSVVSMKVIN